MTVVTLEGRFVEGVVGLQRACYPEPFPEELLWRTEHLVRHLAVFPEGQFVALVGDEVVGSASALLIGDAQWDAHTDWETTTGGHSFAAHDPEGKTLYGADVSVRPDLRGRGVGRALYEARFDLVRQRGLARYGTACRLPDWREWALARRDSTKALYALAVVRGEARDRTLTPLLRYGLRYRGVIEGYMDDEESGDAAALLEWTP